MQPITKPSDSDPIFLQERKEKWNFFIKSLTYIIGMIATILLLLAFFLL